MQISPRPPALPSAEPSSSLDTRPARSAVATFRDALHEALRSSEEAERALGQRLRGLSAEREASPGELIALQAAVYRTAREAELFSKLADRASSAVRQTLQSNQG